MPFGSEPFSLSRAIAASRRASLDSEVRDRSAFSSHHPPTEIYFLARNSTPVYVRVEHDNNFQLHAARSWESVATEADSIIRADTPQREASAKPVIAAPMSTTTLPTLRRRRGRTGSDAPAAASSPVLGVSMRSNAGAGRINTDTPATEKLRDDESSDLTPLTEDHTADIFPAPIEEAVPRATSSTPCEHGISLPRTPLPRPGPASPASTPLSASSDFLAHASRTRALADAMLSRLKVYREEK